MYTQLYTCIAICIFQTQACVLWLIKVTVVILKSVVLYAQATMISPKYNYSSYIKQTHHSMLCHLACAIQTIVVWSLGYSPLQGHIANSNIQLN